MSAARVCRERPGRTGAGRPPSCLVPCGISWGSLWSPARGPDCCRQGSCAAPTMQLERGTETQPLCRADVTCPWDPAVSAPSLGDGGDHLQGQHQVCASPGLQGIPSRSSHGKPRLGAQSLLEARRYRLRCGPDQPAIPEGKVRVPPGTARVPRAALFPVGDGAGGASGDQKTNSDGGVGGDTKGRGPEGDRRERGRGTSQGTDLQRRPRWTPLSPGRFLGWALPLGTATQASLPPYRQHGGPCEIRAHGASLASRPGDKCGLFGV